MFHIKSGIDYMTCNMNSKPQETVRQQYDSFSPGPLFQQIDYPNTAWKEDMYCDLYQCPRFSFFPLSPFFSHSMQRTTETLYLSYKLSFLCSESINMFQNTRCLLQLFIQAEFFLRQGKWCLKKKKSLILIPPTSSATKCNTKMFLKNI